MDVGGCFAHSTANFLEGRNGLNYAKCNTTVLDCSYRKRFLMTRVQTNHKHFTGRGEYKDWLRAILACAAVVYTGSAVTKF